MYSLGIDVGTSGIRAVIMDKNHCILAEAQSTLPASKPYYSSKNEIIGYSQEPNDWWQTFETVIFKISEIFSKQHNLQLKAITHLAIDGTSGTVLLCNESGEPLTDALMYNDQRSVTQAELINQYASDDTAAIGTTSGLAKVIYLFQHYKNNGSLDLRFALNQSDWLSGKLMDRFGISDHNNALKMGYDAQNHCWPDWLLQLLEQCKIPATLFPQVNVPGHITGQISLQMAEHFGFNSKLNICAGTTDSTAAIIASGAHKIGDAITSLGSTLVMKVVSEHPIFNKKSGVYSQPYGHLWLVGGGSNSGGEVLKKYFTNDEILNYTDSLNDKIEQSHFTLHELNYYPLLTNGERFPIHDSNLKAKLSPIPNSQDDFFQAILEGMSDIEALAYNKLVDLGASYPKHVRSIGGGSKNRGWQYIRELKLGVPVILADYEQAAVGTALLAQTTWN